MWYPSLGLGADMAGEAIFIGYRRDDTADVAGRIYDAMGTRFGSARIFKDVDNIGPGVDFGDYIKTVLPRCRVALILIGPHWLSSTDENGKRRVDNPHDWVRVEIETALATRGLLVVPVLVNGAQMPRAEDLPDSLRPLLRRNAAIIRRDPDFHDDVDRLAAAIRASVNTGVLDLSSLSGKSAPARSSQARGGNAASMLLGAALALGLAGAGYFLWSQRELPAPQTNASTTTAAAPAQTPQPTPAASAHNERPAPSNERPAASSERPSAATASQTAPDNVSADAKPAPPQNLVQRDPVTPPSVQCTSSGQVCDRVATFEGPFSPRFIVMPTRAGCSPVIFTVRFYRQSQETQRYTSGMLQPGESFDVAADQGATSVTVAAEGVPNTAMPRVTANGRLIANCNVGRLSSWVVTASFGQ